MKIKTKEGCGLSDLPLVEVQCPLEFHSPFDLGLRQWVSEREDIRHLSRLGFTTQNKYQSLTCVSCYSFYNLMIFSFSFFYSCFRLPLIPRWYNRWKTTPLYAHVPLLKLQFLLLLKGIGTIFLLLWVCQEAVVRRRSFSFPRRPFGSLLLLSSFRSSVERKTSSRGTRHESFKRRYFSIQALYLLNCLQWLHVQDCSNFLWISFNSSFYTRKLRNFLALTAKVHFLRLSFIPARSKMLKVVMISMAWPTILLIISQM